MALNLSEAKKHASNPQELAIVSELAAGPLLSVLPFREIQGNGLFWKREESLGDVGFRNYNANYAEAYAEVSQQSESLRLFGGDIKIDRAILELEGPESRAYQVQAKTRAMRLAWESLFINGDSDQSPSEFDGLSARMPAGAFATNSQVIRNASSAAALDLGKLDEAIDAVDAQGGTKYLVMSKSARRHLTKQARTSAQIDIARNEFGYQQMVYAGLPVIELDRDHQNAPILDSSVTDQSMYIVTFGNDLLTGIQNGSIQVRDLGESTASPQIVIRVEWYCGLAMVNGRSAARLTNINANA